MDKSHAQAQETRRKNQARRLKADMEAAEHKAAIMAVLESVATDQSSTVEQKLEAARLAVELHKRY